MAERMGEVDMASSGRFPRLVAQTVRRVAWSTALARLGRFRAWPPGGLLLEDPVALAEERTNRLRRIYAHAGRDIWDGPEVFRAAVTRRGGIQLAPEKRAALAHPIAMLMWGELGAWIVSAELAERLDDADARMAASSQVFDEARHFYVLRDYLALLHVPAPPLDPYFAIGVRRLLGTRDLTVKLLAMQILAEGTATAIFRFLIDAEIEPVLSELLPYIERDEARHVGLGILHLPSRLAALSPRALRRIGHTTQAIGDLFGLTQVRYAKHYEALGADPRDLYRRADRMLHELSRKLGRIPGTGQPYFRTANPSEPPYEENLAILFPPPGVESNRQAQTVHCLIDFFARWLPA